MLLLLTSELVDRDMWGAGLSLTCTVGSPSDVAAILFLTQQIPMS